MKIKSSFAFSVLVVNYNSIHTLKDLLFQFEDFVEKFEFEILIFNNDILESYDLDKIVSGSRLNVKTFEANNIGFGKAINFLSREAIHDKLLIVNPDCRFEKSFDLHQFIKEYNEYQVQAKVGFWAPVLIDDNGNLEISFGQFPSLVEVFFRTFFFHKIFARYYNNRLSIGKPFLGNEIMSVPYPSGAFFLIDRTLFIDMGGFSSKFFAYFEESELCLRLKKSGYINLINPKFRVVHLRGNRKLDSLNNKFYVYSQYKFFNSNYAYIITLFILNLIDILIRIPWNGLRVSKILLKFNLHGILNAK